MVSACPPTPPAPRDVLTPETAASSVPPPDPPALPFAARPDEVVTAGAGGERIQAVRMPAALLARAARTARPPEPGRWENPGDARGDHGRAAARRQRLHRHFPQSMLYGVRLACLCCSEIGVYTAPSGPAPAIVGPGAPAAGRWTAPTQRRRPATAMGGGSPAWRPPEAGTLAAAAAAAAPSRGLAAASAASRRRATRIEELDRGSPGTRPHMVATRWARRDARPPADRDGVPRALQGLSFLHRAGAAAPRWVPAAGGE